MNEYWVMALCIGTLSAGVMTIIAKRRTLTSLYAKAMEYDSPFRSVWVALDVLGALSWFGAMIACFLLLEWYQAVFVIVSTQLLVGWFGGLMLLGSSIETIVVTMRAASALTIVGTAIAVWLWWQM